MSDHILGERRKALEYGFFLKKEHELLERLRADQVRIDTTLSDEGGRFYHSHQRHVVAEIDTMLGHKEKELLEV